MRIKTSAQRNPAHSDQRDFDLTEEFKTYDSQCDAFPSTLFAASTASAIVADFLALEPPTSQSWQFHVPHIVPPLASFTWIV